MKINFIIGPLPPAASPLLRIGSTRKSHDPFSPAKTNKMYASVVQLSLNLPIWVAIPTGAAAKLDLHKNIAPGGELIKANGVHSHKLRPILHVLY